MKRFFTIAFIFLTSIMPGKAFVDTIPISDSPIIFPGFAGDIDFMAVLDPELVWDGSIVRLYYTAVDNFGTKRIALAVSADAKNWYPAGLVLQKGSTGTFDADGVMAPAVHYNNAEFVMYYTGISNQELSVGRMVSDDGYHFSRQKNPPQIVLTASGISDTFDSQGVSHPSVVDFGNNIYAMMYQGHDGTGWKRLGLAVSSDGIEFQRVPGDEGFESFFGLGHHGFDDSGALDPELLIVDDEVRLLYTGMHY
jgi:predicted GH43/DUF377 family glycosyl hydrolase